MIRGLEKFRERFAGLENQYVLIGGTATWLVLTDAGFEPRATTDLDIVLSIEVQGAGFGRALWEFIKEGGYRTYQASDETPRYYRFIDPENQEFPQMLELLSRTPDGLEPPEGFRFVRIAMDDDISSFSAILLDNDYYDFLHQHKMTMEGLSIVNEKGLIPLKAMAWLNLTEERARGGHAARGDINKHRSDVLRLSQLLTNEPIETPDRIKGDMANFLDQLVEADNLDIRALRLGAGVTLDSLIAAIRTAYSV